MAALLAIILLLIPARSVAYVRAGGGAVSVVLVLIHHIHVLMYVPTIAAIVVLRYYLPHGLTAKNLAVGHRCTRGGRRAVHRRAVLRHDGGARSRLRRSICRAGWPIPSRTDLLQFAYIWYQPLAKEIADTWARLPHNILGVPVFALLIWLHTPLWRYFAGLIGALAQRDAPPHRHRRT